MQAGGTTLPKVPHCDFRTAVPDLKPDAYQWESVRGPAILRLQSVRDGAGYLPPGGSDTADVVSKNGNYCSTLPAADGSIPSRSEVILGTLAEANGEPFIIPPWRRDGKTPEGGEIAIRSVKILYLILTFSRRNVTRPTCPFVPRAPEPAQQRQPPQDDPNGSPVNPA
jgi:hypothetical protein